MMAWLDTKIGYLNFQKQPANQISQRRRKEEWRSSFRSKLLLTPGGVVRAQRCSVSCSPPLLLVWHEVQVSSPGHWLSFLKRQSTSFAIQFLRKCENLYSYTWHSEELKFQVFQSLMYYNSLCLCHQTGVGIIVFYSTSRSFDCKLRGS